MLPIARHTRGRDGVGRRSSSRLGQCPGRAGHRLADLGRRAATLGRPITAGSRRAAVLGLASLGLLAIAGESQAITYVLYDVDFGEPHRVGFTPIEGAEPIPRYLISQLVYGQPLVVEEEGLLQNRPLRMDSMDGDGDQISFELTDVPAGDYYTYESWVLVSEANDGDGVTILFDTPAVRTLHFDGDGTFRTFVAGEPTTEVNYTIGTPVFLQVAVDLEHDLWTVRLDGSVVHEGGFGGASLIEEIRVSTEVIDTAPGAVVAIDDVVIATGREDACNRLGFGDLALGSVWTEGDVFETEGVFITVKEHVTTVGDCTGNTTSGFTEVENGGLACGAGRELEVNNVALDFDFGETVREVTIPYGHYGGTVDLTVNGDCIAVSSPLDLDGIVLGGVAVSVWDLGGGVQGCGVIRLGGIIDQLILGGEEFFLDGISYCLECETDRRSAFEDQVLGTTFTVGDEFTSGSADYRLLPYFPAGANCINPDNTGIATIQGLDEACVDGSELHLDDISARITFSTSLNWMVISYGEYAGNVNLQINDDCRNLTDLSDVNGSVVGGVSVWAVDYGTPGASCGQLYCSGPIRQFGIGGDDLVLDNIRVCEEASSGVETDGPLAVGAPVELLGSSPNPLHTATRIRFALGAAENVDVAVYDAGGRTIRTLLSGEAGAGSHEILWDGRSDEGLRVPSGIYWARVHTGSRTASERLVVVR